MEISGHPASRAAFELLTHYPIDWDKAARAEPQEDEPWRRPNMRKPDMLLTAESGWLGNVVHGPDKQAELMRAINDWRAEQGLEAVEDDFGWCVTIVTLNSFQGPFPGRAAYVSTMDAETSSA